MPIYQSTPVDPLVLIAYLDADPLVPLQQSETMMQKLEAAHVPYRLIVKKGGGHGWKGRQAEEKSFADWFDLYLKQKIRLVAGHHVRYKRLMEWMR